ncbi:MAG TPA: HNH endonuclease signature motif containing protein, partial [Acidimicrobiia bacterium]
MRQDVIDRFWGKVAKGPGCWLWQASVNEDGYGQLSVDGKVHRAHRLAWIIEHGEIPVGGQISQRCQNRGCCRPDHLELRVIKVDDPAQRAQEARAKAVKNLGFVEKRGTKSFRLGVYIGRDPKTRRKKYERITFIAQRVETAEEEAVERLAELV